MFDVDRFISDCRDCVGETNPMMAIHEVVTRAVERPLDLDSAFGPFKRGGSQVLYKGTDITILHIVWPPGIEIFPHDHNLWAVIGIHAGIEDNSFYRRNPAGLSQEGTVRLERGDVRALPVDAIHSVANPKGQPTGALHVYGGDFYNTARSEFDVDTYEERPYDAAHANQVFTEANERWLSGATG